MAHDIRATDRGDMAPVSGAEAEEAYLLLLPHAGTHVSFRDRFEPVVEMSGDYSNDVTPKGYYGFETDFLLALLDDARKRGKHSRRRGYIDMMGFVRRPFALIHRFDGAELDSSAYSRLSEDLNASRGFWPGAGLPSAASRADDFLRSPSLRSIEAGWGQSHTLLLCMESCLDRALGIDGMEGAFCPHPDKPELWRRLFLFLGWDGFLDRNGVLTGDLPRQTAAFDTAKSSFSACLANPLHRKPELRIPKIRTSTASRAFGANPSS